MSATTRRRPRVAGLAALGVALSTLAAVSLAAPAQANPGGTALVISEVYGGGGNGGATYTHDFVELYNPTNAAISLTGLSLQYRSAASTVASTNVASLNAAGSVPAHDWFVVTLATGGANGSAVPNVDFAGASVNMSGTSGQIYLANSLVGVDADGAGNSTVTDPAVVDFVGYGSAAIKEGTSAAPAPSNTSAIARDAGGSDSDVNGADFTVANPMHPGAGASAPAALSATNPGNKTGTVGQPIAGFTMAATGGTAPYTWTDPGTTLPPGISIADGGAVSGSPPRLAPTASP